MIMPPMGEIVYSFGEVELACIPLFLALLLIRQRDPDATKEGYYEQLSSFQVHIIKTSGEDDIDRYLNYLQERIPWDILSKYITVSPDSLNILKRLWRRRKSTSGQYRLSLSVRQLPDRVYRYVRFCPKRIETLLKGGELYLPCPAQFNDPFDCSLDEGMRLTFIECGIGCFSTIRDNVLMFSHYADHHRGLCVGFDTRKLVKSMETPKEHLRADIRPVWYFSVMPRLDIKTEPAICATCKHDIWRYEKEYRLFVSKASALLPSGLYKLDRRAIVEIIIGCRASDESIAMTKSLANDITGCTFKKAVRIPNEFGVQIEDVHRL
jgi:hypothetical protein